MNWIFGSLSDWAGYLNLDGTDELTYANTRTRTLRFPVSSRDFDSTAVVNGYVNRIGVGGALDLRGDGSNSVVTNIPLKFPQGAIIVGLRVACSPNASDLTAELKVEDSNGAGAGTQTTLASDTAVGSTGAIILLFNSPAALPHTVTATQQFSMRVNAGSSNAADAKVFWVEATITETRATGHY